MLAPAHRLRRRGDVTATTRAGRRSKRGAVVVHLLAGRGVEPPRAGFIVSRAVGGAVVRNRVRRRLRHLVRDHIDRLPAGTTLVVRALPAAASASYAELAHDLDAALRATERAAGRRPAEPGRPEPSDGTP